MFETRTGGVNVEFMEVSDAIEAMPSGRLNELIESLNDLIRRRAERDKGWVEWQVSETVCARFIIDRLFKKGFRVFWARLRDGAFKIYIEWVPGTAPMVIGAKEAYSQRPGGGLLGEMYMPAVGEIREKDLTETLILGEANV